MKKEKIPTGQGELHPCYPTKMLETGKITLKEASEKIGVACRQEKRIRWAIRDRGIKDSIHGDYSFERAILQIWPRSNLLEAPCPLLPKGIPGRNFSHCVSLLSKLA